MANKTEVENAVETAIEFDKLSELTQRSYEIAVEIMKQAKKLKEAEKEEKHEEAN